MFDTTAHVTSIIKKKSRLAANGNLGGSWKSTWLYFCRWETSGAIYRILPHGVVASCGSPWPHTLDRSKSKIRMPPFASYIIFYSNQGDKALSIAPLVGANIWLYISALCFSAGHICSLLILLSVGILCACFSMNTWRLELETTKDMVLSNRGAIHGLQQVTNLLIYCCKA